MIKVLLITNLFPNNKEPNRGIFVKQEINALKKLCKIIVIAPVPFFPFECRLFQKWSINAGISKKEYIDNVLVLHPRWFVIPKILSSLYGFSLFLSIVIKILSLNKKENFDLIYSHWIYPDGFAAVLLSKIINKPVFLHALGCDINLYTKYFIRRQLIKWALKNSTKTIVVSHNMAEKVFALGINKKVVVVIPNGIDTNLFKPMNKLECRNKLSIRLNEKIILFIGSLEIVKGIDILLYAFNELVTTTKNPVRLIVVGKGSLKESIVKIISRFNLEEKISCVGEINHNDVPVWVNSADVFCLPSIREGMPNVILEAVACGKRIVATEVGGIPELLANYDNALLVSPNNKLSLTLALKAGIEKEESYNNQTYRDWSWEANAQKVYNEFDLKINKLKILK